MKLVTITKEDFLNVFEERVPELFSLIKDFGLQEDGFGYQKSWEHKKIFKHKITNELWCYDKAWYVGSQEKDTCKIWQVEEKNEIKFIPIN